MIRAENAYYVIAVPPSKHVYTYSDIAFNVPSSLVSPIADGSLLTLLTTGYNGTLWNEYADPRAVYDSVQIENDNGTNDTYTQTGSGYYVLRKNGNDTGFRSIDYPFQLCVRTDTIWKTATGYSAGGRIFVKFYSRSQGWQIDSMTLDSCKLTPQVWEQTEKRHVVMMSG